MFMNSITTAATAAGLERGAVEDGSDGGTLPEDEQQHQGRECELRGRTPTYSPPYLPTYLPTITYLPTHLSTYLPTYLPTYNHLPTYLSIYLPTYLPI